LMVTLSAHSVVIGLTLTLLGYYKKVKSHSDTTKALIQADLLYRDVTNEMRRMSSGMLAKLYQYPFYISTPKGEFSLMLECNSYASGANINWLAPKKSKDKKDHMRTKIAQELLDELLSQSKVKRPDTLEEMILKEITKSSYKSDIFKTRLSKQEGIVSYEQFDELLKRYAIEFDDQNALRVPWRNYFVFNTATKTIDIKFAPKELIAYLFDVDESDVVEWRNTPQKERVGFKQFVADAAGNYKRNSWLISKQYGASKCKVNYQYNGHSYSFSFEYIGKKARYFEFNG